MLHGSMGLDPIFCCLVAHAFVSIQFNRSFHCDSPLRLRLTIPDPPAREKLCLQAREGRLPPLQLHPSNIRTSSCTKWTDI